MASVASSVTTIARFCARSLRLMPGDRRDNFLSFANDLRQCRPSSAPSHLGHRFLLQRRDTYSTMPTTRTQVDTVERERSLIRTTNLLLRCKEAKNDDGR